MTITKNAGDFRLLNKREGEIEVIQKAPVIYSRSALAAALIMCFCIPFIAQRIENKFSNRVARALVRSFLNPARSFANLMRFEHTWRRDGRPL